MMGLFMLSYMATVLYLYNGDGFQARITDIWIVNPGEIFCISSNNVTRKPMNECRSLPYIDDSYRHQPWNIVGTISYGLHQANGKSRSVEGGKFSARKFVSINRRICASLSFIGTTPGFTRRFSSLT